jgi:hypothetical protein
MASGVLVPPALVEYPAEKHPPLVATQETPNDELAVAPVGLGVDWMDQLVPFHTSANVSWVPELL